MTAGLKDALLIGKNDVDRERGDDEERAEGDGEAAVNRAAVCL